MDRVKGAAKEQDSALQFRVIHMRLLSGGIKVSGKIDSGKSGQSQLKRYDNAVIKVKCRILPRSYGGIAYALQTQGRRIVWCSFDCL